MKKFNPNRRCSQCRKYSKDAPTDTDRRPILGDCRDQLMMVNGKPARVHDDYACGQFR